jgi:hypothetical protein
VRASGRQKRLPKEEKKKHHRTPRPPTHPTKPTHNRSTTNHHKNNIMSGNLGSGSGGASPYDHNDGGGGGVTPLPDFNASNIRLSTVAPAFGIPSSSLTAGPGSAHLSAGRQPDYLDYDQKGRGIVSTMFTNSGISYVLGVSLGGLYGLREGLLRTPSSRWKVKLNSVLNHCGRHGSGLGNMMGSTAILYSLYEGVADTVSGWMCIAGQVTTTTTTTAAAGGGRPLTPVFFLVCCISLCDDPALLIPPTSLSTRCPPAERKKNRVRCRKQTAPWGICERMIERKTGKRTKNNNISTSSIVTLVRSNPRPPSSRPPRRERHTTSAPDRGSRPSRAPSARAPWEGPSPYTRFWGFRSGARGGCSSDFTICDNIVCERKGGERKGERETRWKA